ncbi:MAG: hypothetical protein R3C14_18675 [Caldilineaceae bacterium]
MRSVLSQWRGWTKLILRITSILVAMVATLGTAQTLLARSETPATEQAEELQFVAVLVTEGAKIEWQASGAAFAWNFTLYRGATCEFAGAAEVLAPIFSSVNTESNTVYYSLEDTEGNVLGACNYWLQSTAADGTQKLFGPYTLEGKTVLYLPWIAQENAISE